MCTIVTTCKTIISAYQGFLFMVLGGFMRSFLLTTLEHGMMFGVLTPFH